MKKILVFLAFILFFCCESDGINKYCDIINNQTINLANPEFINLQVPGGWSYANGSTKGLILYNFGTSYKAFSRECPHNISCASPMTVKGSLKMICPCDDIEYSIIDGSSQTSDINVSVCEFLVRKSGNVLIVTNY